MINCVRDDKKTTVIEVPIKCSACGHECGNADCLDHIMEDAADKIEELVKRCAWYAEEIAVLREKVNI